MPQKSDVFEYLEENKQKLADFLCELVRVKSVNYFNGNAREYDVQMVVADKMRSLGLDVSMLTYDEKQERPNVMGVWLGTGQGESLMLHAHSDTVPVPDPEKWSFDPFAGIFKDGIIYGRGAGDDKWGIAASLYAIEAVKQCGYRLKGDVMMLSSAGEEGVEGGTLGAGPATRDFPTRASFCIVCEGTNLEIHTETNTFFDIEVKIKGKATHACLRNNVVFPQPHTVYSGEKEGVDALYKAMPIIEALYRLERDMSINYTGGVMGSGGDKLLNQQGVGAIIINPCRIEGGSNISAVIGEICLHYHILHPMTISREDMYKIVYDTIMNAANADIWLKCNPPEIKMTRSMDGFKTDRNYPAIEVMENAFADAMGREAIIAGFKPLCDGTFINPYVPCVVFGPQPAGTHGRDERITLQEVLDCAKVFASTIIDWCSKDKK